MAMFAVVPRQGWGIQGTLWEQGFGVYVETLDEGVALPRKYGVVVLTTVGAKILQ